MPLTTLENELRALARTHIDEGRLPDVAPTQAWGGNGCGDHCGVCGKVIPPSEIEYEIEETRDGSLRTFHFHFLCHAAWQFECARTELLRRQQAKP